MGIIIVLSFLVENLISRGRIRVAIYNSYEKPDSYCWGNKAREGHNSNL